MRQPVITLGRKCGHGAGILGALRPHRRRVPCVCRRTKQLQLGIGISFKGAVPEAPVLVIAAQLHCRRAEQGDEYI